MLPFIAAGKPVGYENLASRTKKVAEHCSIYKIQTYLQTYTVYTFFLKIECDTFAPEAI